MFQYLRCGSLIAKRTDGPGQPRIENKRETRMNCSHFAVGASSSLHRCLLSSTGQQPTEVVGLRIGAEGGCYKGA